MRILFADIDGYIVNANIQKYVSQIELFGDEPIKDFEYVKKCIEFMYREAQNKGDSREQLAFIERVYKFVSNDIFEMLKEYRDCFLEYDNLITDEEKIEYIEKYKSNPVISSNNEEIPSYMEYIIKSLKYAKSLIELEYQKEQFRIQSENLIKKQNKATLLKEIGVIIHENPNLTAEEKEWFAVKIYEMVIMGAPFDYIAIIDMIKKFHIQYITEGEIKENIQITSNGSDRGLITIYGANNFNEIDYSNLENELIKSLLNAKTRICINNLNLPFKTINEDNDIIHYDENEDPLKRATSALKRMKIYAQSRREGADDFLTACRMLGDTQVVNYDEIYTKENLIPGVLEGLKHMLESKQVDMIIACSHHTGPRETLAKVKLFKEELPFVLMLPESLLKFHLEPAQMGKRRGRSSKNNQINIIREKISQMLGLNTSEIECILADDSLPNLEGLSEEKQGILYRKRSSKEIESGIDNQVDERFERQFSWDNQEVDRMLGELTEKKANKKLVK